jgi:hypothetical protein
LNPVVSLHPQARPASGRTARPIKGLVNDDIVRLHARARGGRRHAAYTDNGGKIRIRGNGTVDAGRTGRTDFQLKWALVIAFGARVLGLPLAGAT